jgi:hypothetical protein
MRPPPPHTMSFSQQCLTDGKIKKVAKKDATPPSTHAFYQTAHNPRQSVEHLYTKCTYSQRLFAYFKRKFKLSEKLSELKKLIVMDPLIERSLIMIKRLNILRKQLYDFDHQDIKLSWEMFLN